MAHETPPHWDRSMRRRLREGEAAALAELYDRFAPLAYQTAQRVLDDEAATGEVTREVFALIWESPRDFDPDRGPMRSWIAQAAHRLAVERLRGGPGADGASPAEQDRLIRAVSTAARADYIATAMPAPLREALELTWSQRQNYREMARRLGITEAEARRRLRLGLQLLSSAARYSPDEAGPRRPGHPGQEHA
ncbi:sigma-70 family RNA polymerase sigma factor [Streptomyces marincola]|uniref:sigma-70 family RNA polymerase sigma factor n=1 Tax=Streptomyces marincola TaxID=2878388 RepID=UPI001CF5DDDD|nr:sigma-70 family RNA polymerase sigma factor [Streptomyces marincola]UCM88647.1 sigma-70 family RNA polymerase sigma factor [Streptomyces marincola]